MITDLFNIEFANKHKKNKEVLKLSNRALRKSANDSLDIISDSDSKYNLWAKDNIHEENKRSSWLFFTNETESEDSSHIIASCQHTPKAKKPTFKRIIDLNKDKDRMRQYRERIVR